MIEIVAVIRRHGIRMKHKTYSGAVYAACDLTGESAPDLDGTEGGSGREPALRCAAAGYDRSFGQVCSIQVYVDVGSPLGHPGGAVMLRIGIVIIRLGSRTRNGKFFSS